MINEYDIQDMKPTRWWVVEELDDGSCLDIDYFNTEIEAINCRNTYHNSIEGNFKIIEV